MTFSEQYILFGNWLALEYQEVLQLMRLIPPSPFFQLVDNFSPEVVGFQGVDMTGGSSPRSRVHGYMVKITMVDRVGWTGLLPNGRTPWFVHKGYGPTTTNWDDPPSTYLEPN